MHCAARALAANSRLAGGSQEAFFLHILFAPLPPCKKTAMQVQVRCMERLRN